MIPLDPPLRELDYVVVDVETTGGSWSRGHRITEVAAVRLDGRGRFLAEYCTLVNPARPIPHYVSALTRITDEMVRDAPRFHEVAVELRRVLCGAVFVAHNAGFDWRFLGAELDRALSWQPAEPVLCTVRLARRVVPEVRSRALGALTDYFGIVNEARHRAYGDARATGALFRRLLERVEEREIRCWSGLEDLLRRRPPRRKRTALPTWMEAV
ncbi:MAG: 3'-5' exonuclease [Gemmatimonadetes bacterium]|nr:3'-5' exonuclease [Gemmatimonadota bacterium]